MRKRNYPKTIAAITAMKETFAHRLKMHNVLLTNFIRCVEVFESKNNS